MIKSREIVKVRKVGECIVITLPLSILQTTDLKKGDRVMIESHDDGNIIISKEPGIKKNGE